MPVDRFTNTKSEIIKAARTEFVTHGFDGARMQKIADRIGVTKAMIHYYFETKRKLFEEVYGQSVKEIFSGLSTILEKENSLFKKIEEMIDECLKTAKDQPQILSFVLIESSRKDSWLSPLTDENVDVNLALLENQLTQAAADYEIAPIDLNQLMLNIFSLCYFPVLSASINESLLNFKDENYTKRKGIIHDTILNWLTA